MVQSSIKSESAWPWDRRHLCSQSAEHVTLSLLWHTMVRRGAAHGLDVVDYHHEDGCLEVVHRPEKDIRSRTASVASGWWLSLGTCVISSTTGSGNVDPT